MFPKLISNGVLKRMCGMRSAQREIRSYYTQYINGDRIFLKVISNSNLHLHEQRWTEQDIDQQEAAVERKAKNGSLRE